MNPQTLRIPDEPAWSGCEDDLDVQYMRNLFNGKSIVEVQQYFGQNRSIERSGELLFSPRPVFQYYVHAFATFIMSERARGDSDSASTFLRLLDAREERDPGSVRTILDSLRGSIDYVASHQSSFEADEDIYGNFQELAATIRSRCDG